MSVSSVGELQGNFWDVTIGFGVVWVGSKNIQRHFRESQGFFRRDFRMGLFRGCQIHSKEFQECIYGAAEASHGVSGGFMECRGVLWELKG